MLLAWWEGEWWEHKLKRPCMGGLGSPASLYARGIRSASVSEIGGYPPKSDILARALMEDLARDLHATDFAGILHRWNHNTCLFCPV